MDKHLSVRQVFCKEWSNSRTCFSLLLFNFAV